MFNGFAVSSNELPRTSIYLGKKREAAESYVAEELQKGSLEGAVTASLEVKSQLASLEQDVQQLATTHYTQVEFLKEDRASLVAELGALHAKLRALPAKTKKITDYVVQGRSGSSGFKSPVGAHQSLKPIG